MSYIERFKNNRLLLNEGEYSERTIEIYLSQLYALEGFLKERHGKLFDKEHVKDINGEMIEDYAVEKLSAYSPSTRNLYVRVIKIFFRYLQNLDVIKDNASDVLRFIKPKLDEEQKELTQRGYTKEDIAALMSLQGGLNKVRNRAAIALLAGTSLRASELCRITVGDIRHYPACPIFLIAKGGKRIRVEIADWALPYAAEYLATRPDADDDEPFFLSTHGTPLNRNSLYRSLRYMERSAGLEKTGVHHFRHTTLTAVVGATGNIEIAKRVAVHSSAKVTKGYNHEDREVRRMALTNNELAEIFSR